MVSEPGRHPGQEHAGAGVALSLSKRVDGLSPEGDAAQFASLLAEAFNA